MNTPLENLQKLSDNTYPGRGIVTGISPNEKNAVQIYWIMGRSENSRNRIFVREGDFVKTEAFDAEKLIDPSLIIYYPVKHLGGFHIVTNGDHTDTITEFLKKGKSFEEALDTRDCEPDAPNFTPRISGIVLPAGGPYAFKLSIIKSVLLSQARFYFSYTGCEPGTGFCITTYMCDGSPLPSFEGEPYAAPIFGSAEENLERYWAALNEGNRISILVKEINRDTNEFRILIRNRHSYAQNSIII